MFLKYFESFFSVNASFSERFLEKCPTFHSHVGHYKEKFECSFHSWKFCSRVTWVDCNPCAVLYENISLIIPSSIPDIILIELLKNKKKKQHDDFSAPTSGAFDLEIGPYSGEFDQAFLKKSNARGFAWGG